MLIKVIDEYNGGGHLIYAENYTGAFARGKTREEAMQKIPGEIMRYCRWLGTTLPEGGAEIAIVQEKLSELSICDADSDIIFHSETLPLTMEEYQHLKALALKSARDFLTLYSSVPDKTGTVLSPRDTFYGAVPVTAEAMYAHTKNVNAYYFGEIAIDAENDPDIYTCRLQGFETLEKHPEFLMNTVYDGSYGEQWSLRKLCRRFVWHDRIHARAIYRMAVRLCGAETVADPFCFG